MFFYIDPALITIGPLSIRYYGLVYSITFLAIYLTLLKKRHALGFTEEECSEFLLAGGLSMIFFGRLFHFLIDNPQLLINNPLEFFAIWHGGIAFFGSFVGIAIGTYAFLRFKKKPIRKLFFQIGDIIALIGACGLIFGRIANFINQELVGTATTIAQTPWCVNFLVGFSQATGQPQYDVVCRHPYQLYASITHIILFLVLLYITKQKNNKTEHKQKHGIVLAWFGIIYAVTRFCVDFWREDVRIVLGLTAWQLIAIGLLIVSIWLVHYVKKQDWTPTKHKQNNIEAKGNGKKAKHN